MDRSCMPAGQGVGGILDILPAGEILREVIRDAEATFKKIDVFR